MALFVLLADRGSLLFERHIVTTALNDAFVEGVSTGTFPFKTIRNLQTRSEYLDALKVPRA